MSVADQSLLNLICLLEKTGSLDVEMEGVKFAFDISRLPLGCLPIPLAVTMGSAKKVSASSAVPHDTIDVASSGIAPLSFWA